MTAQITDTFFFRGEEYSMIGMFGGPLATPQQFGMVPKMLHTGCYQGYYSMYELTDEGLFLREMTLREKNERYLPIAGVDADLSKPFQATYNKLNVLVPFSGNMRLAKDFIRELYLHMGFQKPTAFKTVFDITLNEGKIIRLKDRSEEMEQKRGQFKRNYEAGDMRQTIDDAFSLDLDIE